MKAVAVGLLAVLGLHVQGAPLEEALEKLRSVDREGKGNEAASTAWQEIAKAEPAALPEVLAAMNGANPLAENWLRAALSAIADRAMASEAVPVDAVAAFLADTKNSPNARVVAYDLIQRAAPAQAAKLTPALLNDPSSDLRRNPVAKLIAEGDAALAKNGKEMAIAAYSKAINSARDQDQIDALAKKLDKLGKRVDLPAHFGFLMSWKLIAPFTNVERKGFDTVFPPEKEIHLDASYEGKGGAAKWVDFTSKDDYGKIDFNKPFSMLKEVTGYAFTEFNSAEARDAQLRLGCKNGWKVWLNGEFIFGRDEYHRGAKLDQYKLPVHLKKGKNTILVKCCQNEQTEQWTVEWEFQMRVCDATGTAILPANKAGAQ